VTYQSIQNARELYDLGGRNGGGTLSGEKTGTRRSTWRKTPLIEYSIMEGVDDEKGTEPRRTPPG